MEFRGTLPHHRLAELRAATEWALKRASIPVPTSLSFETAVVDDMTKKPVAVYVELPDDDVVAAAVDLRSIVDEDLTDVDEEALVETVARYFREQEGVDAMRGVSGFEGRRNLVELIERAVRMAQRTPSVCNRQPWKAYAFTDPEQRKNLLSFQNGNRGFGDGAAQLLVVTSDLQHFTSVGERYQGWIDGGLFAMSLVHALHALGLGACMLNWSVTRETDAAMRAAAGIPDSELVIMMVAVGHLPERLRVAFSARKPLSDVLVVR